MEKAAEVPRAFLKKTLWLLHLGNQMRIPNRDFSLMSYINCISLRDTNFKGFIFYINGMDLPADFSVLSCF